mgnify:CR=1 FL=1
MHAKVVWRGHKNVRHIYPRTNVIKYIFNKWGVPREVYEPITIVFEFCRIFHLRRTGGTDGGSVYASEVDGMYRGERNGIYLIQLNSDLAQRMNLWDEFRKTGVHELRHLVWDLLDPDKMTYKNGFRHHQLAQREEADCLAVEEYYPAVVWFHKHIPYPRFKPRRNPRFRQLILPGF